jgi:hypothetical protein
MEVLTMIRRVFLAFLVFGLVNLAGCGDGGTDPPIAATVTLSPTTLSFGSFGETQQLTTTVLDGNGATISSASVTWESSGPSVASVSSTGLVTAVANGTATITATSGSAEGTASVDVGTIIGTWEFVSITGATASGPSTLTFTETTATLAFTDCTETATYTLVDGTLTVKVTAVDGPACDMIGDVIVFQVTVTSDTLTLIFEFFDTVTVVYRRVS